MFVNRNGFAIASTALALVFSLAAHAQEPNPTTVAPGVISTEMSSFAHSESGRKATLAMQALQRIAGPEDLAEIFTFLASYDARWITGEILAADGGTRL